MTLCADVMHVNGIPFFVAISRHIKHITATACKSMNKGTMLASIDIIVNAYAQRGFKVTNMHMDNAFECLREDLTGEDRKIYLNTVAANEHEPTIERCIRHIKDRCRCAFVSVRFKRMPRRLTSELVEAMIYWINCVPRIDGVHPVISPRTIMTGQQLTAKNVEFQFGDYVQATQPPRGQNTGNSMDERTCDAIYCRPSGNTQGGFWVYKISTNQLVHRNRAWLSHSSDVIAHQEAIAANEGAPDGLVFGDRAAATTILDFETEEAFEFVDDISDEEYENDDHELEDDHELDWDGDVTKDLNIDETEYVNENADGDIDDIDTDDDAENLEDYIDPEIDPNHDEENNTGDIEEDDIEAEVVFEHDEPDETIGVETAMEDVGPRRSARDARIPTRYPETDPDIERVLNKHVYFQAVDQYQNINATMSSKQYVLKAGLKIFKDPGYDAVASEIRNNLHGRGVISPVKQRDVTGKIRKASLPYLMFLKRKRCGKIKARGCADGRRQREFISKEEASSPTVSTHALMATCLVDAIEGRYVATADIPGAFLQAKMDDDVWIKFEGDMVDVLVSINKGLYGPCVCHHKGKTYLYAKANKAIYGCLKSALLFYQLFSGELKKWGFKQNPYDACTFNKLVKGS